MTGLADASVLAPPVGDPIVAVAHVTLRFGGVTSLADVSLQQERGEVLAVIGPNGAGKTSLFNCLTGVYTPQEGTIEFRPEGKSAVSVVGRRPSRVNRLGIARTFQASRLFNALTAFENVRVGVESRLHTGPAGAMLLLPRTRRENRRSRDRSEELLAFVGLTDRADELASALPYGDQRKLEIARALATGPELLLLDEPAAGTNLAEKDALQDVIHRVNTEMGVSVLLIEHDMRLVMAAAHRVAVLNFGRLIAMGTPAVVQHDEAVIEAYLGRTDAGTAPEGGADEAAGPEEGT
ncbi:MAG: ABC transporter ATP-binding protein [Acidobacteriota bacterium]|nr:ABC transporter ATP-binding protein [Acidobacteriota bacterium]